MNENERESDIVFRLLVRKWMSSWHAERAVERSSGTRGPPKTWVSVTPQKKDLWPPKLKKSCSDMISTKDQKEIFVFAQRK